MASAIESAFASALVSPVITGGTGNNISELRNYQRLRTSNAARTEDFRQQLFAEDVNTTSFTSNELLSLNSQSLDLLNGVAPQRQQQQAWQQLTLPFVQQATQANAVTQEAALTSIFSLNPAQRETLSDIIRQFAGSPFDQNTFARIQNALIAAKINPEQISLQAILQEAFSSAAPSSAQGRTRRNVATFEYEAA